MKKNSLFSEYLKRVPRHVELEVDLSFAIADRIHDILETRGISQKEFAAMMNKSESEVSRWLRGTHNFTLETLARISAALNEDIVSIPKAPEKRITIGYMDLAVFNTPGEYMDVKKSEYMHHLPTEYRTFAMNSYNGKQRKNGKEIC